MVSLLFALASSRAPAQQASFTVSVFPNVTHVRTTVRLYNTHLARGGVKIAHLCSMAGDVIEDFTGRIRPATAGARDVTLDVSGLSTGMYFVRIQTGVETATFKLLVLK